jgi:hypothetical protein
MKRLIPFGIVAIIAVAGAAYVLHSGAQKATTSPTAQTAQTDSKTNTTKAKRPMTGQDSFGLSVCDEVPKSLVERILGKTVEVTEDVAGDSGDGCNYFTDKVKDQTVLVQVSYLSVETQKKGLTDFGRTFAVNNDIPMENFITTDEKGKMESIFLIMTPNKFTSIDYTPGTTDEAHLIELAKEVAKIITGN